MQTTRRRRLLIAAAALALLAGGGQAALAAGGTPVTYQDHTYSTGAAGLVGPSADKPQSKLWFNDGSWWALMVGASTVDIYQLGADHVWRDTGTVVDDRPASTGDALWSNGKLYVASRTNGTSGQIRLYRFSYAAATHRYTRDAGFPVKVKGAGSESVTVDRDSLGRLWMTFTRRSTVWVTHSTTSDTAWTDPFTIPGVDTAVKDDDISAVVAMTDKIGVLWSDQASGTFRFAVHADGQPDTAWTFEVPLAGADVPDDHINIKSLLGDDQGRIHVAVKTSLGDLGEPDSSPRIVVLTRTAAGTWTSVVHSTLGDHLTRPQLALDRTNRQLIVMTSDEAGGSVYYKTTPLDDIAFGSGKGEPFITWPGASINNVSTGKDPVDATTGLVGIATDGGALRYYHAEMSLGAPAQDLTPPSITSTTPVDGASSAPVESPVTATFSEALDPATVTGASVFLTDADGAVVPATVAYDSATRQAVLTPVAALTAGVGYTATVTTAVTDVAGNPLATGASWRFTTTAGQGPQTVVLTPVADAYVSASATGVNFGAAPTLQVDGSPDLKSFLKFDLAAAAGRTVQSATLRVPVTTSGSVGVQNVRLTLKDTWTEGGLTYANKPGLDTTIGNLGPTSPATTYAVPLTTSAVQAKAGGLLSLGLSSGSGDDVVLGSRESASPVQLVLVLG